MVCISATLRSVTVVPLSTSATARTLPSVSMARSPAILSMLAKTRAALSCALRAVAVLAATPPSCRVTFAPPDAPTSACAPVPPF